jgi:hypothetical protein
MNRAEKRSNSNKAAPNFGSIRRNLRDLSSQSEFKKLGALDEPRE